PRAMLAVAIATVLFPGSPWAKTLVEVEYNIIETATPSGRATCSLRGSVSALGENDNFEITLTPTTTPTDGHEAALSIVESFNNGMGKLPSNIRESTAAGIEESCDIFPLNGPSGTIALPRPVPGFATLKGVLDIHSHPHDCTKGAPAQGTVTGRVFGPGN